MLEGDWRAFITLWYLTFFLQEFIARLAKSRLCNRYNPLQHDKFKMKKSVKFNTIFEKRVCSILQHTDFQIWRRFKAAWLFLRTLDFRLFHLRYTFGLPKSYFLDNKKIALFLRRNHCLAGLQGFFMWTMKQKSVPDSFNAYQLDPYKSSSPET